MSTGELSSLASEGGNSVLKQLDKDILELKEKVRNYYTNELYEIILSPSLPVCNISYMVIRFRLINRCYWSYVMRSTVLILILNY